VRAISTVPTNIPPKPRNIMAADTTALAVC
jgi:hypothetical protein